jgi:hypothetical protein
MEKLRTQILQPAQPVVGILLLGHILALLSLLFLLLRDCA